MKVPISWLKDYVDLTISIEELIERLTLAGMEVASIQYIGIPQGQPPEGSRQPPSNHLVWGRDKIVLGAIREVKPHPNADRLVLAIVDYGGAELEQCVTGAPNLFDYKGTGPIDPPLLAPFAHEGAEVIDGHGDGVQRMILQERKLRGIPNRSMVCSEMELGISDSHEGILLLDWDEFGHLPPGTPFQDVLGDAVIDLELLPNMARCYSMVGVAREVAALTGATLRLPSLDVVAEGPSITEAVSIDIREPELNPRFTLSLIRDVEIKPSPNWMQRRLTLAGMRPINNLVDVTNYVMLELGQPLHAFDYDILLERSGGKPPTIITRLPAPGEHLITLDGQDHTLDEFNMLVADTAGALSMGAIMGGLESEIYDPSGEVLDAVGVEIGEGQAPVHGKASVRRPATQTVLLEAAAWNFINIRRSMQSQKMSSEAGLRLSRGVHPAMTLRGSRRCIELMRQVSGGVVAQGHIDAYPLPAPVIQIDLPMAQVDRLLGISIPQAEVVRILRALEFEVVEVGDVLQVTAPDHRLDVGTGFTGQADLIEEIARVYGYDRFPDTVIADMLPKQRANLSLEREELMRDALARVGLREIVTYRFTTPEREALLTPASQPSNWPNLPYVALANPIAADKAVMRQTLLAGMLDIVAANARHTDRQMLFEIGSVYLARQDDPLPDEPTHLGIVMTGPRGVEQWQKDGDTTLMDFFDLKGVVETALRDLRVNADVRYLPAEHSSFHPGRAAWLQINGKTAGIVGEIHPLVRQDFGLGLDLKRPVLGAELDLAMLVEHLVSVRDIAPVPTQPAVYQDIALVVDAKTTAADVYAVIIDAGGDLLESARLFDVYQGDPIPAGKKSLAYKLTYRTTDRTLNDDEVAKVHAKIAKAAEKRLGATLRA
ncbi:MAG: phenylalanine--tRNA ligase subunit beta [Chloroflexi bacterium]|nr:phenylalanine--tRNA ligase subunit beta [Chloroflexota bacterium]